MLCMNMAKARRDKLTLKEKNQSYRCKSHSPSAKISGLDEIDSDLLRLQHFQILLDKIKGTNSILMFFGVNVEKLKTAQDSLCVATVETACKLQQTSMDDCFNVK